MINSKVAFIIVKKNLPNSTIVKFIEYKDLFIFHVLIDDPYESGYDPYYSVNRKTKAFDSFSIILDGDIRELTSLFENAKEV